MQSMKKVASRVIGVPRAVSELSSEYPTFSLFLECVLTQLLHLKCIRLGSVRSIHLPCIKGVWWVTCVQVSLY